MLLHELLTLGFGVALAMVFSIIFDLIRFFFVFDSDFLMHVSISFVSVCVSVCVCGSREIALVMVEQTKRNNGAK